VPVVDQGRELTESQRGWLRHRQYLQKNRYELGRRAVELYPAVSRIEGTPLLTRPQWWPAAPLPLDAIDLDFETDARFPKRAGGNSADLAVRPVRCDGSRYPTYSAAVADLAAPSTFANRSTYRLLTADLGNARGRLAFGRGNYFDGIDTGEAVAHEYAAAQLDGVPLSLRAAIGEPCDPERRPINLAVAALTIRHDRKTGNSTFLLHWRDPAKVGHAGGLHMVVPVGIFQPSGDQCWNEENDFSLWRCLLREYAEELGGRSEDYGASPIDYDADPFFSRLTDAWRTGVVRATVIGLGVDPLTLATDLLTVVVFDAVVFDTLFPEVLETNAEGRTIQRIPLTAGTIERYIREVAIQPAGAAILLSVRRLLDRQPSTIGL
jgi:hypothetical protein